MLWIPAFLRSHDSVSVCASSLSRTRLSNCSRRPDSSRLDTRHSARDAFGGGESDDAGGGGAGFGNHRCRFIAVKTRQMTPVFILFVFELLFFPALKDVSGKDSHHGRDLQSRCQIFPQDGGVFEIYYIAQWTQFEGRSGFFPLSATNNVRHWFYMFNFFKSSLSRIATISIQKSCSSVLPPSRRKSFELVSRVRLSSHFPSSGQLPLRVSEEDGED